MSLTKKVYLTISGYDIKLSDNLMFYQKDQLKLIFYINEYGIDYENNATARALMPVNPLNAILFIENPDGVDSVSSARIEDNAVTFYLDSTHTQYVGVSRMQLRLFDQDGCAITLPHFTFEIRENIYGSGDVRFQNVVMVDQTGTVILTEDNDMLDVGDILTMGTEVAYPQVTKTIKELPIKHGLDGTERLIVEDNEATKQAPLGTIVDEIKQNSQEKIREIESELAQTNAQLSDIKSKQKVYISEYPRLAGEIDDYERLMRAYNNTNQTLVIDQSIDLGGNDFIIEKKIEVDGVGSVISNTEFRIKSSYCWLHDFILNCNGKENGIRINETTVDGTTIERVRVREARAHSFLFESYHGTVSDTIVKDCESSGSIHGFISKANSTSFIRCFHHNGKGGHSFGLISDDIEGNMATCIYNKIIDCRAADTGQGLYMYARRYNDGSATAQCRNNYINGFECLNVKTVISIGETTPGNNAKEVYSINRVNISNVFLNNIGKFDIELKNVRNSDFANIMGCRQPYVESSTSLVDIYTRSSFASAIEEPVYEQIIKLGESGKCDVTNYKIFDVQHDGTTENKITITGYVEYGKEITIFVRGRGGSLTYGGFDENKFVTKNLNLPTTLNYNQVLVTKWVYSRITNMWINVHQSIVPYLN